MSNHAISLLFDALWRDYATRLCPSASKVHQLFSQHGVLFNDHIALRTFALPGMGLPALARTFERHGYQAKEEYYFTSKHLNARHYEHKDASLPKVFISELDLTACSAWLQNTVVSLVTQRPETFMKDDYFVCAGRPWRLDFALYQQLLVESEYAAWVAAHGYGANHFTVDVNRLTGFSNLKDVNAFLKKHGFRLNTKGGEIKGSPSVFLEQSSTMADTVKVPFSDGVKHVLGGFYEFALRYPTPSGSLFQGFVEASADKIFESTNKR